MMTGASYDWIQLPDGPRLAVATLPASECASLSIYIPAGSRDESGLPTGLAHFTEHMLFKGTHKRNARELSIAVEDAGGQLNACTTEDHTVYEGRGDADLLPVLADILSDMVWHATFPAAEIELEREVIGEEITLYRENPSDHIGDMISAALWSPHPLGNPISGTQESIATIRRNHLLAFRDRHHLRTDGVIAAAGPFTLDRLQQLLEPLLPPAFHAPLQPLPFTRAPGPPQVLRDSRPSDQLQLALAWHTHGRHHPLRHALRLLSLMLGEASSSRLFLELREERGLCYHVATDVTLFEETGAFEISAGLDPASLDEALDCISREIRDLTQHGPRPGELERARKLALTQSKLAFETTSSHAAWAGECLLDLGHIPHPNTWRQHVLAVSAADIQEAAALVFSNQEPARAEIGAPA